MSFTTADARRQLLEELAAAVDELGVALVALGEAYEALDEQSAERLEEELFRPLQAAYGRGKRTHAAFAARAGLPERAFVTSPLGLPAEARDQIARVIDQVLLADQTLATLQDSMLPVEVGDPELRAGMSEVRTLIAPLPLRGRGLLRTLGR